MKAFNREQDEERILRKARRQISDNIEDRVAALLLSGLVSLVIPDEVTGKRYQLVIINEELKIKEL